MAVGADCRRAAAPKKRGVDACALRRLSRNRVAPPTDMQPLVLVLIPTYSAQRWVCNTIKSVVA